MLRSASHLMHYNISATDDVLGKVKDLFFDDRAWKVRYLVADSGKWLPGRHVLISPVALGRPDWKGLVLPVSLTRDQVKESPHISDDQPVSRQHERLLHEYYGWAPYWAGPEAAYMASRTAETLSKEEIKEAEKQGDPNLRSVKEVTGYHIAASDGDIGHVEDLIVDDDGWWLRYVVVDTRNWLPGRKVLISPAWIDWIRWGDRKVAVDLGREQIEKSPEYDPSAPVNREYEAKLYDFYGRPHYWG